MLGRVARPADRCGDSPAAAVVVCERVLAHQPRLVDRGRTRRGERLLRRCGRRDGRPSGCQAVRQAGGTLTRVRIGIASRHVAGGRPAGACAEPQPKPWRPPGTALRSARRYAQVELRAGIARPRCRVPTPSALPPPAQNVLRATRMDPRSSMPRHVGAGDETDVRRSESPPDMACVNAETRCARPRQQSSEPRIARLASRRAASFRHFDAGGRSGMR